MKTFNQHLIKIVMSSMVSLFTISALAQKETEKESGLIYLDTVAVVANQHVVEKLVSRIVLNKNFKYRKTLKKARLSKKQYVYLDKSISEAEILKHFKKAARKSESIDEFISYFYDRNLSFMSALDVNIISSLYHKIRKTTLNGYLDELESVVGTGY